MDPSLKLYDDRKNFKFIMLLLQLFVSKGPGSEMLSRSDKIAFPPPSVHISFLHHALIL